MNKKRYILIKLLVDILVIGGLIAVIFAERWVDYEQEFYGIYIISTIILLAAVGIFFIIDAKQKVIFSKPVIVSRVISGFWLSTSVTLELFIMFRWFENILMHLIIIFITMTGVITQNIIELVHYKKWGF